MESLRVHSFRADYYYDTGERALGDWWAPDAAEEELARQRAEAAVAHRGRGGGQGQKDWQEGRLLIEAP